MSTMVANWILKSCFPLKTSAENMAMYPYPKPNFFAHASNSTGDMADIVGPEQCIWFYTFYLYNTVKSYIVSFR